MNQAIKEPIDINHEFSVFNGPEFAHWQEISDINWDDVTNQGNIIKKKKGSLLYGNANFDTNNFVVLLSGKVKVYSISEIGRGIYIDTINPGDMCPLQLSKVLGDPFLELQSFADSDVTLLTLPKEMFFSLNKRSAKFSEYILRSTSKFSRTLIDLVKQVSFQRLPIRLATHIKRQYQQTGDSKFLCTHQSLANELGTTREVVSRLLKEMESKGSIRLRRGAIEILCEERLKLCCESTKRPARRAV